MEIRYYILLSLSIILFSCVAKNTVHNVEKRKGLTPHSDVAKSALKFAEKVLSENLRIKTHERVRSSYLDVQMIFETDNFVTDNFIGYTSYSNQLKPDNSEQSNYDGFILFVATYKNSTSAEHAFQKIKTTSQIRIAELEGFSGLTVEQVQVYERIRKSGGLITQKDKYVFYLVETCGEPPAEANWSDYENLLLRSITESNEEIEVLNAECEKDIFRVQRFIQNAKEEDSDRIKLMNAAREIMTASGTCALITQDHQGRSRVRVMDPFLPEGDFTIWFGTNPQSRKVDQIKRDPRVTLYYFDTNASAYVMIHGKAQLVDDLKEKKERWKDEWNLFYPDKPEGYLLIKVSPESMEVISESHGIVGDSVTWKPPIVTFNSK